MRNKKIQKADCLRLKKGQGGVEYVVFLSFTVVFFIIIVYVVNEQLSIINKQQRLEQARLALNEIGDAATEVYQQGSGAQKTIKVVFPQGVTSSGFIVNNTLHIVFEGSDLFYQLNFPISGTIPTSPGSFDLVFTSYGNSVSTGIADFSLSDYNLLFTYCYSPSPQSDITNITITNSKNVSNPISVSLSWPHTDINITLSNSSFELDPFSDANLFINISISPGVMGTYAGFIIFSSSNFSISLPVSISIDSCGVGSPVSYIIVDTYKDANYTSASSVFHLPPIVIITATDWPGNAYITLDLKNQTGHSMPGYPKIVLTNDLGSYTEEWNATGYYGNFTLFANYSIYNANYTFTVEPC